MPRVKSAKKSPPKKRRAANKAAPKAAVAAEPATAEPTTVPGPETQPAKPTEELDLDSLKKIFDDAQKFEEDAVGLRYADAECPYCGENFEIAVDPGEEGQEMIQDCRACCKPINFYIEVLDGEITVDAFGS
jgi:hypothetical protein